jgi:hypothetical protein
MMPDVMTHWLSEKSGDATLRDSFLHQRTRAIIIVCSLSSHQVRKLLLCSFVALLTVAPLSDIQDPNLA